MFLAIRHGSTGGVHHACYDCRNRLAKEVFELAFADASGRVLERKRLSREAFSRVLDTPGPGATTTPFTRVAWLI